MRFIHAADLHLDSPLRGLARYEGAPVQRLRTATRGALERLIDLALAQPVDFLLLAGDIYDGDWQDFHTGLFFREQLARLNRAGIRVFMIQGNHDAQGVISRKLVLPPNVTVFDSRSAHTARLDDLGVAIHGRSFRDRAEDADLVPAYPPPVPGLFNIGLLHTSLSGRPGHDTYAPTTVDTLVAKGYDYWALGHVHCRELVRETPRIVFPGNLQGRHANETGPKGCELVRVEAGHIAAECVPLALVRWDQLRLDLTGMDRLESLGAAFREALVPRLAGAGDLLHAVRVTLTGCTGLYALEAERPGTLEANIRAAAQDVAAAEVWIEQVRVDLTPPLDREQMARREDAMGELVRLVDALHGSPGALADLAQTQLGGLLNALPPEVAGDEVPRLDRTADLLDLLRDAEATVLARLAAAQP
ncbi:DNA repair exonuclease [uncultured Thiodictyon sp.]|uniref:metallophosphoesterase family protein n=1 Tax=uncultured Thiodictyon sp. TaxID=1846217 RepID=UPI0025ED4FCE|nr:DNA repair exonuclease [uncultured Thiodictyon sp.]